ncbi:hypothetical protein D9758_010763 [Tetrapyrgos nigripes]|uniref:Uncharacterized protein n=1 Tax=Tetrapyrgos nigripes TaxID=182062 RepID=A0A8H5FYJ1_9AGAR|nr:hypothetical protein D9758_010763 [Tetrapyrgos nigripes]
MRLKSSHDTSPSIPGDDPVLLFKMGNNWLWLRREDAYADMLRVVREEFQIPDSQIPTLETSGSSFKICEGRGERITKNAYPVMSSLDVIEVVIASSTDGAACQDAAHPLSQGNECSSGSSGQNGHQEGNGWASLSTGFGSDRGRRPLDYESADPLLCISYPKGKERAVDVVFRTAAGNDSVSKIVERRGPAGPEEQNVEIETQKRPRSLQNNDKPYMATVSAGSSRSSPSQEAIQFTREPVPSPEALDR